MFCRFTTRWLCGETNVHLQAVCVVVAWRSADLEGCSRTCRPTHARGTLGSHSLHVNAVLISDIDDFTHRFRAKLCQTKYLLFLSKCVPILLFVCPSSFLSVHCLCLSICLEIYLSIYLSPSLSISPIVVSVYSINDSLSQCFLFHGFPS